MNRKFLEEKNLLTPVFWVWDIADSSVKAAVPGTGEFSMRPLFDRP
jgi:hypothetical protein